MPAIVQGLFDQVTILGYFISGFCDPFRMQRFYYRKPEVYCNTFHCYTFIYLFRYLVCVKLLAVRNAKMCWSNVALSFPASSHQSFRDFSAEISVGHIFILKNHKHLVAFRAHFTEYVLLLVWLEITRVTQKNAGMYI